MLLLAQLTPQIMFPFNCLPPSMETWREYLGAYGINPDVSIQLFAPINGDSQ